MSETPSHGCSGVYIYPHLCPLPPRAGLQSYSPAPPRLQESPCKRKLLIFLSDCTNMSRGGGGGRLHTPHAQTNKHLAFCKGIITVAPAHTRPVCIKTKQDTLGDLIRLPQIHCSSESLLALWKCERVSPDVCKEFSGTLTVVSRAERGLL